MRSLVEQKAGQQRCRCRVFPGKCGPSAPGITGVQLAKAPGLLVRTGCALLLMQPVAVGFFNSHVLRGRAVAVARRRHPYDHIVAMAGRRHVARNQAAAVAASPVNMIMGNGRTVEVADLVRLDFDRPEQQ